MVGDKKSRFLDSAGSYAFADDPAALEMTIGNVGLPYPASLVIINSGFISKLLKCGRSRSVL